MENKNTKAKNKKDKVKLSKEEANQIKQRMLKLRKANKESSSATQSSIPYATMYQDGTCHIQKNKYSQTIEFYDTNYQLATFEEKDNKFLLWCNILNYFDESIEFQNTYENQIINKEQLTKIVKIGKCEDSFDDIRSEYSDYRCKQLTEGKNSKRIKKYLTFTIEAKNKKIARTKLNSISDELISLFSDMKVSARKLNGEERLESIYHSCNPFISEPFIFDWNLVKRMGYSTKDFVAPTSLSFKKSDFEIADGYGSITSINILAGELSDKIISDYLEIDGLVSLNFHIKPYDQLAALKYVRGKHSDVQKMKIDEQKKAFRAGYDSDILPENIQIYLDETRELLEDLNSRNERLFDITVTVRSFAPTKAKSDLQVEQLKRITQKNNCKLINLDYMQEQGFASSLPIGYNSIPIKRELRTSSVAVFIPFSTQELFQVGGTYYGLNSVTKKMLLANRKTLKNPNGLYLGVPGGGKSFAVKREMVDVFLTSTDDILITDPEGEYYPIVSKLNGQVIVISSSDKYYINPMDINIQCFDDAALSNKSDFLISLCEQIAGGKFGLSSEEISAIDKCVRRLYQNFMQNNPTINNMPLLQDLLVEFRQRDVVEILSRVANSLDMYVSGSQNLFNHHTNVDINNRLVCFDIKKLGSQLKKLAMLIIQESVWNRVEVNRGIKSTRYYIDEFHLLLRDEQTAKYSVEMWKRFRKWGGIPTGITQNVKDLLSSPEIENILDNSDFIYMLSQSDGDRRILQQKLNISDEQIKYVAHSKPGRGLIFFGDTILPFEDTFPEDTLMFKLLNTDPAKEKNNSAS